jgi:hypothetical protein
MASTTTSAGGAPSVRDHPRTGADSADSARAELALTGSLSCVRLSAVVDPPSRPETDVRETTARENDDAGEQ